MPSSRSATSSKPCAGRPRRARHSASRSRAPSSSAKPQQRGGRELGLGRRRPAARRSRSRGSGLDAQPAAGRRGTGRRSRRGAGARPRVAADGGADVDAVAEAERDRRARGEACGAQQDRLPASGARGARGARRGRPAGRRPTSRSRRAVRFASARTARGRRRPGRPVVAGEALGGPSRDIVAWSRGARRSARGGGRAALRAAGSRAARGRRRSRRWSSRPRAARRTRAPGRPGSKPWTTSKAPRRRASATLARTPTGNADRRARRNGHGRREGDDAVELAALERAAAREEVGRARRRRQHDDGVTARAQCVGDAGDVLVHVVRLRPRVRGHEADAERHGASIVGPTACPSLLASQEGLAKRTLCPRGAPDRRDAASSVAPISPISTLPASLPRDDRRHPGNEARSADPSSRRSASSRAGGCRPGRRAARAPPLRDGPSGRLRTLTGSPSARAQSRAALTSASVSPAIWTTLTRPPATRIDGSGAVYRQPLSHR